MVNINNQTQQNHTAHSSSIFFNAADQTHPLFPQEESSIPLAKRIQSAMQSVLPTPVPVAPPAQHPTIQNSFLMYVRETEAKSHVPYPQALSFVQQGEAFVSAVRSGIDIIESREEKRAQIVPFTWWLFSKACEKGEGFYQGTFVCEDPGYRLFSFFREGSTSRWSSHYTGRREKEQYGIDNLSNTLPFGFHTVLFGKLLTPPGTGEWFFWKPENFGVESKKEFSCHCLDFLLTRMHREKELERKEHVRSLYTAHLDSMKRCGVIPSDFPLDQWGIAGAVHILTPFLQAPERIVLWNDEQKTAVRSFLRDALQTYDWLHIRKGHEVVIAEHHDTVKELLQALFERL